MAWGMDEVADAGPARCGAPTARAEAGRREREPPGRTSRQTLPLQVKGALARAGDSGSTTRR
jgi:hypothetical protein